MPEPPNISATERSPLLANQAEESARPAPNSHGSAQNASPNDIESNQQTEDTEDPAIVEGRKKVKSFLPILGVGIFLAFLDQSIVAAINGEMGSDLHALKNVSWIATAYFLTMTASQPLYGKLSDVFGRKPCLLFAYTMFGVGSLGCGVTGSMEGLIAARAIQGIGGGGMLIVVTVLFSDFIPLRERGTYQAYLNLIGAIGSTSGGPIGGLFVQSIGWRWAFLIQVLVCLIAIASVGFFLHLPKRQSETPWRKQLPHIDILGALLLILTIFTLLFGLDRGSNLSWRSPLTIASLYVTIPLSIAFVAVETHFAVEPFTPGHVIFDKALFACYIHNFFLYAAFTALIFYLPLFFKVVLDMTPAQAGASLIPAAVSAVVGTLVGGIVLRRTGKFYWLAVLAATAAILGAIPMVVAPSIKARAGAMASVYVGSVVTFIPQGVTVTASLLAIISNVSAADQAVATACSFLFRSLGAAVGVSIVGVLIQFVLKSNLHASSLDPEQADRILNAIAQSLEYVRDLPPELRAVVHDSYAKAIQAGFAFCLALLAVAATSVVWWREGKLDR